MNGGAGNGPKRGRRDYSVALFWSGMERGGQTLLLFVSTVAIARLSGPSEFGAASLALSITFMLETACERLFRDVIVQRDGLTEEEIGTAFGASIVISLVAAVMLAIAAPLLARLFGIANLGPLIALSCASIAFAGSGGVLAALLHRKLEFGKLARRTLLGSLAGSAVGLVMVLAGFRSYSLVGQYVAQSFAALAALVLSVGQLPRPRLGWRSLLPLLHFGLPVTASEFIWNASFRAFVAVVGYLAGPATVGFLEFSMRIVQSLRNFWQATVGPVALSLLVASRDSVEQFRDAYRRMTALSTATILPAFGGIVAISHDLVVLTLGPDWLPAVAVMQILAVAAGISVLMQFSGIALNAVGRPNGNVVSASLSAVAALAGLLVFGVAGARQAAIIWLARLLFSQPFAVWKVWSAARLQFVRDVAAPNVRPLLATSAMVAATHLLDTTLLEGMPPVLRLPVTIVVGAAIYASMLLAMGRHLIAEARLIAGDLRPIRPQI